MLMAPKTVQFAKRVNVFNGPPRSTNLGVGGSNPSERAIQSRVRAKYDLERVKGIEPSYAAWEAAVLPLNYTRMPKRFLVILALIPTLRHGSLSIADISAFRLAASIGCQCN